MRADQQLGLVQRLGLVAGRIIPGGRRDDLGVTDLLTLGVVVLVHRHDIRTVVDGGRDTPGAGYFESSPCSAITSEASREKGTLTPERFTSQTVVISRS